MDLSNEQLKRYSRQIVLKEIGSVGQSKLLNSSVLVIGAGGLGSNVLYYLAASGIGTLGIVDFDTVDISNLHRQIIHFTDDLEKPKVISAKEKINKLNPSVNVITFNEKLTKDNIENIFGNFEIIVDCLDNFSDKFLVNDTCVKLNKKLVHGGVIGFEGQVFSIIPYKSACLRCYLKEVPSQVHQTCKEIGTLPTCVGIISTLQANEVIKLILDIGKPYTNRVLKFDGLTGVFYEFDLKATNEDCPVCPKLTLCS